ncbi:MAG: DUF3267 domain-containing protein [Bacteroidales bacterium]|nr:DUF3267 domain-containing protein [Bacteroidales bacterium]
MKPTVEELKNNPQFELLDKLSYDRVLDFASNYIRKQSRPMRFFYFCLLAMLALLLGAFLVGVIGRGRSILSVLKQYGYGIIISFTAIIPIHEIIHGIVYFLLGARKIRFGAELKQFAFYAVADKFVTQKAGFNVLALSPFIIITLLNLAGFLFVPGVASYTYISVIFFHTTMCIGDFALLSYYDTHRDKEIYSFDDVANRMSYFYHKKTE